jgi:hypothetical protein
VVLLDAPPQPSISAGDDTDKRLLFHCAPSACTARCRSQSIDGHIIDSSPLSAPLSIPAVLIFVPDPYAALFTPRKVMNFCTAPSAILPHHANGRIVETVEFLKNFKCPVRRFSHRPTMEYFQMQSIVKRWLMYERKQLKSDTIGE